MDPVPTESGRITRAQTTEQTTPTVGGLVGELSVDHPGLEGIGRVIGRVDGVRPGPTLLCVAAVHGNEPAGVLALRRIAVGLAERRAVMRGRFVALAGNLAALRQGKRFLDSDLNRMWTRSGVRAARAVNGRSHGPSELREQAELLAAIDHGIDSSAGPVYLVDLHTTSGSGGPFTTVADTLPNRAFALGLPVPLVLGLEEQVSGTLLEYMGERGLITLAYETGQHEETRAVSRAEAGIWIVLAATGLLRDSSVPELTSARALLEEDTRHFPRVLEMRYRHAIEPGDDFRMGEGYRNFQPLKKGETVASDREGGVVSPEGGRILMPLYQEQGNDGFFVVREFRPFWLRLSTLLRRLDAARFVHWLPGIRRVRGREHALLVDRSIARWYPLQILHLLGFRKLRARGSRLLVTRRHHDH